MTGPRSSHRAPKLADGRVLLAGGASAPGSTTSSEIFDTPTETFTSSGPPNDPHTFTQAVVLRDGRVLLLGVVRSASEIYDPASGPWAAVVPPMPTGYMGAATALLPNSGVFVARGESGPLDVCSSTPGDSDCFAGYFDDIEMFSRALIATEIARSATC